MCEMKKKTISCKQNDELLLKKLLYMTPTGNEKMQFDYIWWIKFME